MRGNSVLDGSGCYPPGNPWSPQLFEEITDLLAEALYKDFQEHRRATVDSHPGINHANLLTPSVNEHK